MEDTYEQTMEKVRTKVRGLLSERYRAAANKEQVFNSVTDLMIQEAGSFTLLQIVTNLK